MAPSHAEAAHSSAAPDLSTAGVSTPGLSREEKRRDAERIDAELHGLSSGTDPFAAAVRATRMPMIVTDPRLPDNPVVFANDAFCRLTGYAREEILGRNCRFLQGPQTDPATVARIRAAVAEARPLEIDVRNHKRSGEPFWNRLLVAPVRDADGKLAYFFASLVDVTPELERLAGLESHNAALMVEVAGRLRAQQASEERLRFAASAGRLGFWELDRSSRTLTGSTLFREIFGRDPAREFSYEAFTGSLHPDDCDRVQTAIGRSLATGEGFDAECRILRPDGAAGWVQMRAQVALDSAGTPLHLAGVSLDVSERREAEEELRRTSQLLRAIIETAPGLIYAKDRAGRMLIANSAALDLIGKPWSEVAGRSDREFLFDPAQGEAIMANDRRVMEEGHTEEVEELVGTAGGPPRTWLSTKAPLRDTAGEVVGMVGISVDITTRKRAEEALQRLNTDLETLVAERTAERDRAWKNSQDLIAVVDGDGIFRAANPAWTAILGWHPDEVVGRHHLDFVHPDDRPATHHAHTQARVEQLPAFENRVRHRDGSTRIIAWVAAPDGGLIYASGRNVTAEREAADHLARIEDLLRQSQKMEAVGQLTGGIAHDFNNLLTAITGSLELLQRRIHEGRTQGLERYTSAAITASQRAGALTQRLLAFARRQPLDPKRVDINRLVAGMEELLRRTLGPAIALEMVLAGGLWATLCDPNQMESAILNLAINARDAMPDGGRLTIETSNAYLDDAYAKSQGDNIRPGQYVAVAVSDTGVGMPPEVIERAFDPFFTTKPIGRGTGLGLSMLYGFVKQSDGNVRIYSEPGNGTTFRLYLPRLRAPADTAETGASGQVAAAGLAEAGESVLVVDDEPALRMLVAETLRELGYAAILAEDGPSAVRILQSDARIDLLITDVGLPGLNGRQVADAGRAKRPGLRVLFITGYAHNAAIGNGAALEPGMQIITKPFALEALGAKVREMIEVGAAEAPA
jgi:PAS domain S-box-containing protein